MKKTLLIAGLVAFSGSAFAMEPLTAEQLEDFRIMVSKNVSDGEFAGSFACGLEYSDASNPSEVMIQNFNQTGLPLRMIVDWEAETVKIAPYAFYQDFDYDTNEIKFEMVVNGEAAELSSPTDPAFSSSYVTGTISEDGLTLDNWNIVVVNQYFSSMTKKYTESRNSVLHKPNTTMQWATLDWDYNWDYLEPAGDMSFGIYSELEDGLLKVYNWDDMSSCVVLHPTTIEEEVIYQTQADEIICKDGKYNYGIYPLPGLSWEDLYEIEEVPLIASAVFYNKLEFGPWVIYDEIKSRDRSYGNSAILTFDFNILNSEVNVKSIESAEAVNVSYFNLQGVEIENPTDGLYIKITTDKDGNRRTVKVLK